MEIPLRFRLLRLERLEESLGTVKSHSNDGATTVQEEDSQNIPISPIDSYKPVSPHSRLPKPVIKHQRRQFLQLILAAPTPDRYIHSPTVFRERLFAGFVNDLTWLQSTSMRYRVLEGLRAWFDIGQENDATVAATEALLLAQLSLTLQDRHHLAVARRRYGLAIARCSRKLSALSGGGRDHWFRVLPSIQALGVCEMYEHLSQGDDVWIRHNDGMLAVIRQLSISADSLDDNNARMIIYNAIDSSLKAAIVARQPSVFGEAHWLETLSSSCKGGGWCLQHVLCRLPALLHQMDDTHPASRNTKPRSKNTLPESENSQLGSSYTKPRSWNTQKIASLLQELVKIERDMHRWLRSWYAASTQLPISTRNVTNFREFADQHRDVHEVFPSVFDFPSPAEAHGHLVYYDWLNIVRQAICSLHLRPESSCIVSKADRAYASRMATESADAACMLAPYSSQMEKTEPSKSLLQLLEAATAWYEKTGQVEKLQYTQSIMKHQAKHDESEYLLRWEDVNGFLARRVLLQQCIGPPACILTEHV